MSNKFPIISSELVVRVQKPDNTSANRFWRNGTAVSDTEDSREERQSLAAELNALSLLAKEVPSTKLPMLRFAVATVDHAALFLASLPVNSRDSAGRATGVLIAGACATVSIRDIMAAYETACAAFGWTANASVQNALEEVYSKRPKVEWMMSVLLLAAFAVALLLIWRRAAT
ncbi:MAG: hypothetical protein U0324_17725 [Polyangiales bacterium]